ncbi:MAG: Glu-tRNA(Gln) amidotransferase subunit GatE [Thermoplasmata archaeon]
MRIGLEVHLQLRTGKLFCRCPCELRETVHHRFVRRLTAAAGESRAIDPAARAQAIRGTLFCYETTDTSCLVEADEEPPHPISEAALESALIVAEMLGARVVDEVQVMRKIVVDGSNPSGFQRTALIAVGGHLEVDGATIPIETICLEEDASRKTGESDGEATYRLDRQGIPLLEIATGPVIRSGAEARRVAEEIGALLRNTDRVRRGIGTVREDLNISVEGGARVEVKGVQELREIESYVDAEARRQEYLLELRDRLRQQGASPPTGPAVDLSPVFPDGIGRPRRTGAGRIPRVHGLALPGFASALKGLPEGEFRLGRELADRARRAGVGGLLHSDELPGHGVTSDQVAAVSRAMGLRPGDAFVLVADDPPGRAEPALEAVRERARQALEGVPSETRDPMPGGRTRYSRPLAGEHRLYPETDVPPIPISGSLRADAARKIPERPAQRIDRLRSSYGLSLEAARQLVLAGEGDRFEALVRRGRSPPMTARMLTQELPTADDGGVDRGDPGLTEAIDAVLLGAERGLYAKEALGPVLVRVVRERVAPADAARALGLAGATDEELDRSIEAAIRANLALLRERGEGAFQPLMGDLMREFRGRRDGQEIARRLRGAIDRALREATS